MQITSVKVGRLRFKPSALGWLFFMMILLGWVMSVNYNNNLLYMVVFTLISLMFVTLILGWLNMRAIRLIGINTSASFVGEKLKTQFNVSNGGFTRSEAIFANRVAALGKHQGQFGARANIISNGIEVLDLDVDATKRGRVDLLPLSIASVYPIGLFVFSKPILSEVNEWVYPEPKGDYRLEDYLDKHTNQSGIEADEMQTLRPYQPSDSPSHINWKVYARSDELMTSDYDGGVSIPSVMFDDEAIKELDLEQRLSQLSKWLIEAEKMGGEYGLKLGGDIIPAGKGAEHHHKCLIALAQFKSTNEAELNQQPSEQASIIQRLKAKLNTPIGAGS